MNQRNVLKEWNVNHTHRFVCFQTLKSLHNFVLGAHLLGLALRWPFAYFLLLFLSYGHSKLKTFHEWKVKDIMNEQKCECYACSKKWKILVRSRRGFALRSLYSAFFIPPHSDLRSPLTRAGASLALVRVCVCACVCVWIIMLLCVRVCVCALCMCVCTRVCVCAHVVCYCDMCMHVCAAW